MRRHILGPRRSVALLTALVVLGAAACSDDDGSGGEAAGTTLTLSSEADVGEATLEDAASVVRARLADLEVAGNEVVVEDGTIVVDLGDADATIAEQAASLLERRGALYLRPALCQVPTDEQLEGMEGSPPPKGDDAVEGDPICAGATTGVVDPGFYAPTPSADNQPDVPVTLDFSAADERYRFGPAQVEVDGEVVELDSSLIAAARPEQDPNGKQQVALQLARGPEGAALDAHAASCSERDAACPTGRSGLILDETVFSMMGFQEPEFGDTAVIPGDFTEQEAAQLAAIVRSGALPVPFDVAVSGAPSPDPSTDSE